MVTSMMKIAGRSGEYILIKEIGKGGMGSVWSANWIGLGNVVKPVAIKFLHGSAALSKKDRERFLSEARIGCQIRHAQIVGIFDVGETDDGELFLVMEWVDGKNLREFLKAIGGQIEWPLCCHIMGEVLKGLARLHAHEIGAVSAPIIHYDIKWENVMISSMGEVMLTDFGIARFAASSDTTMSRAIGTLHYMPPEQMMGRARLQSDIHACGVVFFDLLAFPDLRWFGDVPAHRFQQTLLSGYRPEITRSDVEPWVPTLQKRMVDPDPELRILAEEALEIFLDKTPGYQHGGTRLKKLYLKHIGGMRSGVTGMFEFPEYLAEQRILSAARQTPTPILSNDLSPEANATPNEPTLAEPHDERVDDDSPIVFRRHRGVTPAARLAAADQVVDRTSTKGPPMLDAIFQPAPPAAIARGPVAIADPAPIAEPHAAPVVELLVEPTEVLPPLFADDAAGQTPPHRSEPDLPVQTLQFPGSRPVPIADAPSGGVSLAPVSGPHQHQRTGARVVIGVLGVVVVTLLGIVIKLTIDEQPASAEQQPETVEGGEVELDPDKDKLVGGPTIEPPSASTIEPQPDPTTPPKPVPDPVPEQEPVTEPTPPPTEDAKDTVRSPTEEAPPVEPEKPKVNKAATTKVIFIIRGASDAEIKVNGRTVKPLVEIKLRSGKKYPIEWRQHENDTWRSPGTLIVDALPAKSYYEVYLTSSSLEPHVRKEGG